jgi:predicted transcriptional regulator of viral defense system
MASSSSLPQTFRFADLPGLGVDPRVLRRRVAAGEVERLGRGVYRRADAPPVDPDRLEVALLAPLATLCLGSALAEHGLSDEIPRLMELALPRGKWQPVLTAPVAWHSFSADTFAVGRTELLVTEGAVIGLYSAERTLIDVFRLPQEVADDAQLEALRRWVRRRGSQPGELLAMASASFPRVTRRLRRALEVLG